MTSRILLGFTLLAMFSTSQAFARPGHGKDNGRKDDLVTKGPDGEVFHYACEGEVVKITKCEGEKRIEKAADCKGPSMTIKKADFLLRVKQRVTLENAPRMKPLDEKDIAAFRLAEDQNRAALQERLKDLEFFGADGTEAQQKELAELRKKLSTGKDMDESIKKVNALISDLVDKKICDTKTLHVVGKAEHGNTFLFSVLEDFDPELKKACGREGATDEENIKACSKLPHSTKGNLKLVMRQKDGGEVWSDGKVVWYPALEGRYTNEGEVKDGVIISGPAFEACKARGLRLPTKAEFEAAERMGIREVHTDFKGRFYWSSSVHGSYDRLAWGFDGNNGYFDNRGNQNSVRCVR